MRVASLALYSSPAAARSGTRRRAEGCKFSSTRRRASKQTGCSLSAFSILRSAPPRAWRAGAQPCRGRGRPWPPACLPMASFARRAPLAPPAGARRARARAPPGRPLFCRRRRRRAPPCACGSQRDGRAGRADDAAAPSPAPAGAAAPGAARWGDARPSGRRLLGGAATALAVALGGNFLESTSALLGLAPQNARSSRLDVLYPVSGYLRCYRPDIGVEFIYPRDWAADQTLAQRAQRRAELTRGLDPPSAAAARQVRHP